MFKASIGRQKKSHIVVGLCVLVLAITMLIFPMSLNWVWDEGSWGHHGQYEKMTEAILDGHLYMDYDVDPKLLDLENPYDRGAREAAGVTYEFDHAFYDGHYYMYFGIVPVFLLFIPVRLLGITLAGSHGTQIFAALAIMGIFALFYDLARKYYHKLSLASYLSVSVAASFVSLWYAVKYPSLYCTAITSGICLAIWGICFCFKAFVADAARVQDADGELHVPTAEKRVVLYATLGALCSALVFGCRPTIGFVSILYIPMIWHYVKNRFAALGKADKWKLILGFCLPYIIVASLLMLYNYVRFDNPFEFGQSYQLTLVDQHQYMGQSLSFGKEFWTRLWEDIKFYFVAWTPLGEGFPHIHEDGLLYLFPIVILGLVAFVGTSKKQKEQVVDKSSSMAGFAVAILTTVFVIIFVQTKWSPNVLRRYAMDFTFLLMILVFLGVCRVFALVNEKYHKSCGAVVIILSVASCLVCVLLFFTTGESAMADVQPELIDKIERTLYFWK